MSKRYYYIYEVTNLVNGKTYIGQHSTENIDDNYLGSGKVLQKAIKKYGKHNFQKEILLHAVNQVALNFMEKCLVTKEFIEEDTNYNMREGGGNKGSPSLKTRLKLSLANKEKQNGRKIPRERVNRMIISSLGRKDSLETRKRKSLAQKGLKKPRTIKNIKKWKMIKKLNGRCWLLSEETKTKMSISKLSLSKEQIKNVENLLLNGISQRKILKILNLNSRTPIQWIAKNLKNKNQIIFKRKNQYL